MKLTDGDSNDWDSMRRMLRDFVGKRRCCPFKAHYDAHHVSYKRFRRRITRRSSSDADGPAASTPLATGRQYEPGFELDTVCQRLELDSPPRHRGAAQKVLSGHIQDTASAGGVSRCGDITPPNTARARPAPGIAPEQGWVWRAAAQQPGNDQQAGSDERKHTLQPFATLEKASVSLQGKSVVKLAAPSLLNDYYTNLLDCSCNGVIALALGSSVYLWNSETRAVVGYLDPSPQPEQASDQTQSISCLSWSRDGRALCVGTRRGEIQLWDVEHKKMRCLPPHMSVVRALSWKQQLLSSGSVLGRIHHLDPRAPTPLVGAADQKEAICSLQWSPGDDWLASGSTEGLLSIWDSDIAGLTRSRQPITTMKQPSTVKAMGWCPWQRKKIATGGGWKDGELRIWDTDLGTCVASVNTNSQICSLRWAERKRYLITGHGHPHHQVNCWSWDSPSLSPICQLTGHSNRVLHLALNPDGTQIFSAGADQRFLIWDTQLSTSLNTVGESC